MTFTDSERARFLAKTEVQPAAVRMFWTGDRYEPREVTCREWVGATSGRGAGRFQAGAGRWWTHHRFAYTDAHGPIPDGYVVITRCRNPRCAEPSHLEAVPPQEPGRRGGEEYRKTHPRCPRGHLRSENTMTYPSSGGRYCGACNRERAKEHHAAQPKRKPKPERTHCRNGHPVTPENTLPSGDCRPCNRAAVLRYKQRKAVAHPASA